MQMPHFGRKMERVINKTQFEKWVLIAPELDSVVGEERCLPAWRDDTRLDGIERLYLGKKSLVLLELNVHIDW